MFPKHAVQAGIPAFRRRAEGNVLEPFGTSGYISPPCGRQHSETRRAECSVSKILSAGDRPHLHTTHQAAFCDMLLIHHKSFAPDKQLSHAGDTCILLREEEPVIRQRSETCRAGETVRSPPLRRGKD